MRQFLIIFDQRRGELLLEQEFADWDEALRARFAAEREGYGDDVEIIVLGADSPETLRHTHAKYFKSIGEIVRDGVQRHLWPTTVVTR